MTRHIVLLVEQDSALQLLYSEVLRGAGYDVCELTHDDDIVGAANMYQPAVALISGGRRGLYRAGWQAAQRLRANYPELPLVMITTNSGAGNEVGQTARGRLFTAALHKPFPLDDLLKVVGRITSGLSVRPARDPERSSVAAERPYHE